MSLKIGSHVSMSAPKYLAQAVQDAISYDANALMFYSGAPQNTKRVSTSLFQLEKAKEIMAQHKFDPENLILHAPYIINLANTIKPEVFELAVDFLTKEIKRAQDLGVKIIVLHPGSYVQATLEEGISQIVKGLDMVFNQIDPKDCIIALETMAGKGSEVGRRFEEIAEIISRVEKNQYLGVCLDTCHIHDAGYDLSNFDQVLVEFDQIIGLDRLKVIHVNDSKNVKGAKKDRHANIGFGEIGFENLLSVIYHPKLDHLCKILETPWVDNLYPGYKQEIAMIKAKQFDEQCIEKIRKGE